MHGKKVAGYGVPAPIVTFGYRVDGHGFDIHTTGTGSPDGGYTLHADTSGIKAVGDNPSNPLT